MRIETAFWAMRFPLALVFACTLAAGPLAGNVAAQRPGLRVPAGALQRLKFDDKGIVHSLGLGVIRMVSDDGQPWTLELQRDAVVEVFGQGGRELLRQGTFVRFEAEMDETGNVAEEISELTLFAPSDGYSVGVMREEEQAEAGLSEQPDEAAGKAADGDGFGADSGPRRRSAVSEDKNTRTEPDRSARRRGRSRRDSGRKQNRRALTAGRYLVAGQIQQQQDDRISVVAGGAGKFQVQLSEQVQVKIQTSRYDVARPGDQIQATGFYYRPGEASASKVRIDMAPRQQDVAGEVQPAKGRSTKSAERD